jgi:hypothetical protein
MANILQSEKKVAAVSMLCEGNSIRSIERITGVHRDTIMRLGLRMGESCQQIMDDKMHDLNCKQVECDEIWGFIGGHRPPLQERRVRRTLLPFKIHSTSLDRHWTFT